jgi:hypothetical protein
LLNLIEVELKNPMHEMVYAIFIHTSTSKHFSSVRLIAEIFLPEGPLGKFFFCPSEIVHTDLVNKPLSPQVGEMCAAR